MWPPGISVTVSSSCGITGATAEFYQPVAQVDRDLGGPFTPNDMWGNSGNIVVRSTLPPEQMENALRSTVRAMDAQLPLNQVQTMEHAIQDSEAPRRFNTVLISSFAGAAVLLALMGIYSVIAFSVALRVQEIAIRMALGSPRTRIVGLVMTSGGKLAVLGCVIGLAGSIAASRPRCRR